MPHFRNNARFAGALFLVAIVAAIVGGSWLEALFSGSDPLSITGDNRSQFALAVAFEYLNGIAVIGIGALLFPVLRLHNEALAVGYVGLRIAEAVVYLLGATLPLMLLAHGSEDTLADASTLNLILSLRSQIMELAVPVLLGLGSLLLYYSAYQTRILPRFLAAWGLAGAVMVIVGNIWDWSTFVQMILVLPILTAEVFLAIWLIFRGFNNPESGD